MKKLVFILVTILVIASMVIVGCDGDDDEATPTPEPTVTEAADASPTIEPQPTITEDSSDGSLSDILGAISRVDSVKYDTVLTLPDTSTYTTSIWIKGTKMKTESTTEVEMIIIIIDLEAQTSIMYMPDQGYAMEYDMPDMPDTDQPATELTKDIEQYDPTIIGTDAIDGHECTVIEYTEEGSSAKMWIEKTHGFPIRVETTTSEGTTIMEYKNIDFSDIPDSEFELPEGVEIMDLPSY